MEGGGGGGGGGGGASGRLLGGGRGALVAAALGGGVRKRERGPGAKYNTQKKRKCSFVLLLPCVAQPAVQSQGTRHKP